MKIVWYIKWLIYNLRKEKLTPSYHGENCLCNGDNPKYECCCDACDYYLACFPDWEDYIN